MPCGGASLIPRLCWLALCGLGLWTACESTPDDLREWRAEDHPAPPAVAQDDRAAPAEAGGASGEARVVAGLWTARCARCHGADGRGGGSDVPPGATMPDFADPTYQGSRTDNALALTILQGKGLMPAFEGELTARQIALLVRHVRAFAAGR